MERSFQTSSDPGETRARVMAAAADLIATRGYAGTSISAISKASGVFPSSMYWEFGSKEGILAAVLEESANRWLDQSAGAIRHALAEELDRDQALSRHFEVVAAQLSARPEFLRLLLLLALERRDADQASLKVIREIRQRAVEGIARLYTVLLSDGRAAPAGPDAHDLARLTLAVLDGSFVAKQIDPDTTDLEGMYAMFAAGIRIASRTAGRDARRPHPHRR